LELGELLPEGDYVLADLSGQHGQPHELVNLEAIAAYRRTLLVDPPTGTAARPRAVGQGHHREQLGLGACLQAETVGLAKVQDLLDDMTLLVDLDGIDTAVAAVVLVLRHRPLEGVVDLAHPV